ncbi:hypothetical protein DRJ25_02705 [Candidatus Woesearchaeota archaeon]|nr:MAG: hypothetical protein DRJ25_02705 [Candidatus Woesearchaeota archaeon]
MQIITKEELLDRRDEFIEKIREGAIFIYPTDTIYGIGCNALLDEPVKRIREWKGRKTPFSVIAPDKDWITKHCETKEDCIEHLPGPYTLVYPMKNQAVSKETSEKTIGVRIPKHWISELVKDAGVPVITTSVNKTGEIPLFSLDNVQPELRAFIDFAIDEGELKGRPSEVIDCTTGETLRKR